MSKLAGSLKRVTFSPTSVNPRLKISDNPRAIEKHGAWGVGHGAWSREWKAKSRIKPENYSYNHGVVQF